MRRKAVDESDLRASALAERFAKPGRERQAPRPAADDQDAMKAARSVRSRFQRGLRCVTLRCGIRTRNGGACHANNRIGRFDNGGARSVLDAHPPAASMLVARMNPLDFQQEWERATYNGGERTVERKT